MRSQALLSWRGPYGGDEGVASASTVGEREAMDLGQPADAELEVQPLTRRG